MQTALELYFNDNNSYPDSLTSGSALSSGTNVYMNIVPTAPSPADGDCTAIQNTYTYTKDDSGRSYTIDYCIGDNTGDVEGGVRAATPAGLDD